MQASGPKGLLETVGRTPLLRLTRVLGRHHAAVLVKAENRNPLGSVKDRIGLAMIEAAEADGAIEPGGRIIEPTSGNTGIALAFVAAAKGYPVTLTMPDSMSTERRALLLGLGADFILTPAKAGMRGAIERAEELLAATRGGWMPRQFENPANPAIHEETTGPEIWAATAGQVDIIVAGVGTGGTITGVSRFLKMRNPNVRSIAVEPAESAVLSGGPPGQHGIQGIGAGFVPRNFDRGVVDAVETVTTAEAMDCARRLAREEGLLVGVSSGANVAVAHRLASRPENAGKTIVTFACSTGERYLSTPLYQLIGMSGSLPEDDFGL
ncbi:MAG: cysteine synthase A [Planctomycetia bacterium]|jgi:cysteine synthase A